MPDIARWADWLSLPGSSVWVGEDGGIWTDTMEKAHGYFDEYDTMPPEYRDTAYWI
jgi:hypothetical protein